MCARLSIDQNDSIPFVCAIPADVLPDRVPDGFVVRETDVARLAVRVDHRLRRRAVGDEALERVGVRVRDDGRADALGLPVLDADHCSLTDRPTARVETPTAVLVLLLAADEGLIGFDRTRERGGELVRPGLTDAVEHEPRGLLRHAEIAVELHA